jgi:hypothetical protein
MNKRIDALLEVADAISRGQIPEYQHGEGFTAGAFDLLLVNVNGVDAFTLLGELCERYELIKASGKSMQGYYSLLAQVARQTNTTEMLAGLSEIITEHPELSHGLQTWYRRSA